MHSFYLQPHAALRNCAAAMEVTNGLLTFRYKLHLHQDVRTSVLGQQGAPKNLASAKAMIKKKGLAGLIADDIIQVGFYFLA